VQIIIQTNVFNLTYASQVNQTQHFDNLVKLVTSFRKDVAYLTISSVQILSEESIILVYIQFTFRLIANFEEDIQDLDFDFQPYQYVFVIPFDPHAKVTHNKKNLT